MMHWILMTYLFTVGAGVIAAATDYCDGVRNGRFEWVAVPLLWFPVAVLFFLTYPLDLLGTTIYRKWRARTDVHRNPEVGRGGQMDVRLFVRLWSRKLWLFLQLWWHEGAEDYLLQRSLSKFKKGDFAAENRLVTNSRHHGKRRRELWKDLGLCPRPREDEK